MVAQYHGKERKMYEEEMIQNKLFFSSQNGGNMDVKKNIGGQMLE